MAIENDLRETASGKWLIYIGGNWQPVTPQDKEEDRTPADSMTRCPKCKNNQVKTEGGLMNHIAGNSKVECTKCGYKWEIVEGRTTEDVDYEEIKNELPLTNQKQLKS